MGWFTPKCPYCGGPLQATGYSAPYPTHRCNNCIARTSRDAELRELRERLARLENGKLNHD